MFRPLKDLAPRFAKTKQEQAVLPASSVTPMSLEACTLMTLLGHESLSGTGLPNWHTLDSDACIIIGL